MVWFICIVLVRAFKKRTLIGFVSVSVSPRISILPHNYLSILLCIVSGSDAWLTLFEELSNDITRIYNALNVYTARVGPF